MDKFLWTISVCPARHCLQLMVIPLTKRYPAEFRIPSRDSLMQSSYLDARIVSDRTIDNHIKNLRKKLSESMAEYDIIHTIHGVGYKIE